MSPHLFNLMPPLRTHAVPDVFFGGMFVPPAPPLPVRDAEDDDARSGLKERNRLAAKKWRLKKDHMLGELESENDALRKQALDLVNQAQALRVQNRMLEDELLFFQGFMSKMMTGAK
jgi:putative heme degradation protein